MKDPKSVLVVGGAGYIGSHTTLALIDAGFCPIVYDNFSTGHRDACFGDAVVDGELEDRALLAKTLKKYGVGSVIHFAALIEAGESMRSPLSFFRNNVASTISLLEAMHDTHVKQIVFSSTAAGYGDAETESGILTEDLPMASINPYGHSKCMVETILNEESRANGLQAIALRYFNASGADPGGRTGERHNPETHLIPLVIEAAQNLRDDFNIFGSDYATPDGTCIRDFIHVSDLAQGHVLALKKIRREQKPGFDRFNLGTGMGHSVREVVDTVRRVTGKEFQIREFPRRPGDPAKLVADPSQARAKLGWHAKRSDISTIVEDAWRFAMSRTR